jgi:FtsH-binding integral membrane protein
MDSKSISLPRSEQSVAAESARFMSGVYRWMTVGILLTALVSYFLGTNIDVAIEIASNRVLFYGLLIGQLGLVLFLSASIQKLSARTATGLFLAYAVLTGVTLSVIFLAYTMQSIQSAFFVTTFAFGGLSAFGYLTKRDLGPVGTFCHMGLWGLVGFAILSWIFPSLMDGSYSLVYSLVGLIVFSGLAAYDTQKIKKMNVIGNEGTEDDKKETIMGALTLYLDFINLFLVVLRLMNGKRK